ncbi:MAG TPA: hypothetical protein VE710_19650 [Candidatus Bathyarchaeia archaeon]|nr:hypothetical protein [Candidatus Bathyarchaeia archaeon]
MFSTKKVKMLVGAMALALSVGSLGAAYAAADDQTDTTKVQQTADQGKHMVRGSMFANNEDLLALLNLSAEELQAQLKEGKTLAAIIEAQGASEDEVVDLLVKQQQERLAQAVKDGKLTQEQADEQSEKLNEKITSMVENTFQGRIIIHFGFKLDENEDLLKLLNLDADKLKEELQAGKSLADITEAQGVDEGELIDLLTEQQEANLAEAVKAGKLTQEQADKMSDNAAEKIKSFIENTHPGKGFGGGGFHLKNNEELLKLLNLTADELQEALKAGKSLAEVAEAQGVSTEDVIDLLTTQREEQLDQAVEEGKLTKEQADQKKENLEETIKKMVESKRDKGDTAVKTVVE